MLTSNTDLLSQVEAKADDASAGVHSALGAKAGGAAGLFGALRGLGQKAAEDTLAVANATKVGAEGGEMTCVQGGSHARFCVCDHACVHVVASAVRLGVCTRGAGQEGD
jgi:hypothetical protein